MEDAASVDAALLALEYWAGQVKACEDAGSIGCSLTFVCSQTNLSAIHAWISQGSLISSIAVCQVSFDNKCHQLQLCTVQGTTVGI